MQLVSDWRRAWRWLSVRALIATGALPSIWLALPADWRAAVPACWLATASFVMALLGVVGRLTQQAPTTADPDGAPK